MSLFSWWSAAQSFFSSTFTVLSSITSKIRYSLEWLASQRLLIVGAIVAGVKGAYDFSVVQINHVVSSLQGINFGVFANSQSLGDGVAFANSIIPLSETFAFAVILLDLWVICTVSRMVFKVLKLKGHGFSSGVRLLQGNWF